MLCYAMMQGSKARTLCYLQKEASPVLFGDDPPTTSGRPVLPFWTVGRLKTSMLWTLLLLDPDPSPRVTNHPFPDLCQPFPLQKASYSSGRRGTQTTPRSPPQHWEAQSAPLGAPYQCWGSCVQGKCSTFLSPPALTILWLCCWEPAKMGTTSKSEALMEHKNLTGGWSCLA